MGRFETEWLASDVDLASLTALSGVRIDQIHARKRPHGIVLDMDSSESPTHGRQKGAAWNGHFGCKCDHPLIAFNQFGDLERSLLGSRHVHSAADWRPVLHPVVTRSHGRGINLYFRAEAAFAKPEIYDRLEEEGIEYAIRLPANDVLSDGLDICLRGRSAAAEEAGHLFASFRYQAKGRTRPRRGVGQSRVAPG